MPLDQNWEMRECGEINKHANDTIRRLLNQALFEGFYIYDDESIVPKFAEPFNQFIPEIKNDIRDINAAKASFSDRLSTIIEKTKCHIQAIFGCGTSYGQNKIPHSNGSKFFGQNSLSKELLVERMRDLALLCKANTWGVNSENPKFILDFRSFPTTCKLCEFLPSHNFG